MPSDFECYVYVVPPGSTEFVTAGRFSQSRNRQGQPVGTFVYGRRYRERADAVELDPVQLRLRKGPFETARLGGFFGALRDALPDHWGRRVIARHGGLGEPSDFDLLLLGPDDRCGAVGFGLGVEPPAPQRRFHRTLDLERIRQAADAILSEEPQRAGWALEQVEELLGQAGTSMGGARPKTTVEADHALWLAKFPAPADTWNQPRVEHGLLLLARSRSWQLSPAYDLTPAPVQAETRRDLAMACGLVDRSPSRWANRRAILAAAGRFLLQPAEAEAIATRIFTTVATSWEACLREAAVSPDDCQRLSRAFLYPGLELDPDMEG
jgi:hypothetical protein